MINRVVLSKKAQKQLLKVPVYIFDKLQAWIKMVKKDSLEQARKMSGFHDEPLWENRRGQRSIRLSRAYRGIYTIEGNSTVKFVYIKEVMKHEY